MYVYMYIHINIAAADDISQKSALMTSSAAARFHIYTYINIYIYIHMNIAAADDISQKKLCSC